MAALSGEIQIVWSKRPVQIITDGRNGFFHFWILQTAKAVVELECGTMTTYPFNYIKFLDSDSEFKEYIWPK